MENGTENEIKIRWRNFTPYNFKEEVKECKIIEAFKPKMSSSYLNLKISNNNQLQDGACTYCGYKSYTDYCPRCGNKIYYDSNTYNCKILNAEEKK